MSESGNILNVELSDEMKKSYMDYAMSVIVGRALPDVRDGLKPVHRRILYTMNEGGFTPDKPYRKCATTVGDVLGKYHPHGDAAVYDSLVRMAQDFSLRYPLVDGHGNFGSVDGDPPAAYRYTEARMSKLAMEMLRDIEKETVDFIPNYDERLTEPVVLPSRFPNLLVNGSSGIAVGMATNIPPHNLNEVIDGILAQIDNPAISIDELMTYIKGPDFPTAGLIMGQRGIKDTYRTGRGRIVMRARCEIETLENGRNRIIVTELPYQVNKARLIMKIADLVKEKRIEGISDLRDESDREGMRVVIELKRDANGNVVLNQLYKNTQLQQTFNPIMLALVNNQRQPKVLNLYEILDEYIKFQKEVIRRRSEFELKKALDRAHILEGLKIALDNIDEIIRIIRASYDNAKERLKETFSLSDIQAQAILDLRLARLQGLEREKIDAEYNDLLEKIKYFKEVLANERMVFDIIKDELSALKEKYGDKRKTLITAAAEDIDIEDLIEEEENVVTMTHFGYIKRLPTSTYKSQHRGGRGIAGLSTREEDFVETIITASTHANLLFFTNRGKMYRLKTYQIPEAGRQARGVAIVNLLQLDAEEKVTAMISVQEFSEGKFLIMATKNGIVKKSRLGDYDTLRKGGLIAINLDDGDELIKVKRTDGAQSIIIGTGEGMAIHFSEKDVRPMGRAARGVRAIRLMHNDYVVGMILGSEEGEILTVTEKGFGKKTPFAEYRRQNRGGRGIITYKTSPQTGKVVALKSVTPSDDLMLITSEGIIIRISTSEVSSLGRRTKGVRLMRPAEGVKVVAAARTEECESDDEACLSIVEETKREDS